MPLRGDSQNTIRTQAPNLDKAYERVIQLLASRAKAYARFWELWVRKGTHTTRERIIPQKHRSKLLYEQDVLGEWDISPILLSEAHKLSNHQT